MDKIAVFIGAEIHTKTNDLPKDINFCFTNHYQQLSRPLSAPIPAFPQTGKGDAMSVGGDLWLGFDTAAGFSPYPYTFPERENVVSLI